MLSSARNLFCAIEVVLRGVGNFSQFVQRAGFRRRQTAGRVGTLNVRDFAEDTVSAGFSLFEQQPRNCTSVRSTTGVQHARGFYFAATLAFPVWPDVVSADFAVITRFGVQRRDRRDEVPSGAIEPVDLSALRVHMKREFVSFRNRDAAASGGQL